MTFPEEPTDVGAHVVRLSVTGRLGDMDLLAAALKALQAAFALLDRTAHRVVGDRADTVRWQLSGVREGGAMTLVEAAPTSQVQQWVHVQQI